MTVEKFRILTKEYVRSTTPDKRTASTFQRIGGLPYLLFRFGLALTRWGKSLFTELGHASRSLPQPSIHCAWRLNFFSPSYTSYCSGAGILPSVSEPMTTRDSRVAFERSAARLCSCQTGQQGLFSPWLCCPSNV